MRRAVIDRRTTETQIALTLGLDGKGRYRVRTGIRFLDHMLELFARHGAFDLRIKATGDLDVDQHHTVEDLGIALGEAVSQALGNRRGINRAGYFVMPMDETLAVAAIDLGGRPHTVVDLQVKVRAGRRSADRAGARLLRGLRHRRARERPRQGAVRPIEPPQDRGGLQGVRPRAARGLREGQAAGADAAAAPRGCCDCAHRLQGRQSDVGEEGARRDRRGRSSRRHARGSRRRRRGVIVPGVGHFGATRALDARVDRRDSARVGEGRPLLGICLGMQWLFEGERRGAGLSRARAPAAGALPSRSGGGTAGPQGPARRLEQPRRCSATASIVEGVAAGRAGVLHAQLRRAGHRRHRRRHRARRAVRLGRAARARSPACSFIPRSRATSGCRILRNFVQLAG